jgi:hypothetical protein
MQQLMSADISYLPQPKFRISNRTPKTLMSLQIVEMLEATTLALYESMICQLTILFVLLVFLYYFVVSRLDFACHDCHQNVRAIVPPCTPRYYCFALLNDCLAACCINRDFWSIYCCSVEQVSLRFAKHAPTRDTIRLLRSRVAE